MQDLEFRQLVERVKVRSPIEAVVSTRVPGLRKRGALFWAPCPFHEERTPSFAVDPRRATWRCFGACGEGGDVLSFVQRFDGLSFLEALRLLAQAAGEELPEGAVQTRASSEGERRRATLVDVLERAQRLFEKRLWAPEGAEALAYARGRGFRDETLCDFGIGWAPVSGGPGGGGLVATARSAGIAPDLLVEAGLAKRDGERVWDFFRGRLMIPIKDRLGRTVGFGGRHLPGDSRALGKYVNTPETALFRKGSLVFGLDRAAPAVRQEGRLFLVEGYTDVMAAHQAGVRTVAAVLGTALTEEHAQLIRRSGARRVTLVFDGDDAGKRATERALHGLLATGIAIDVLAPGAGLDPCDVLVAEGGAERFRTLAEEARDWLAWRLDGLAGRAPGELASEVDEVLRLVLRLPLAVEQDLRLAEIARALALPGDGLLSQWRALRARERFAVAARPEPARTASERRAATPREAAEEPTLEGAYRALIGALLLDNSLIPLYAELAAGCPRGDLAVIFAALLERYENGALEEPVDASAVMTALAEHPARDRVVALEELARTAESPLALARDQALWLGRQAHERALGKLKDRLSGPARASEGDPGPEEVLRSLHQELRKSRVPTAAPEP